MRVSSKKIREIIQEEIGLVLVLPGRALSEPQDVTDAPHPSDVVPREDAWAGGDNIEDDLDHVKFETGESNAGPNITIYEERDMNLRQMILQEAVRLIREGHGCRCEACPKCEMRGQIMAAVEEPSDDDVGGMAPVDAFGAGYTAGQEEREVFNYTGDLSDLTPDEAIGLGHQAGLMGLDGETDRGSPDVPHPESYRKVRQFLQANPDLVDTAVEKLMKITGSTCPVSTRRAIYDYLSDSDPSVKERRG